MDKNPYFAPDDVVEFELRSNGKLPRWNYKTDFGGSGLWFQAKVKTAMSDCVYTNTPVGLSWCWTTNDEHLLAKDGYVRLVDGMKAKAEETNGVCRCNITDIWNNGNDGHIDGCPEKK